MKELESCGVKEFRVKDTDVPVRSTDVRARDTEFRVRDTNVRARDTEFRARDTEFHEKHKNHKKDNPPQLTQNTNNFYRYPSVTFVTKL